MVATFKTSVKSRVSQEYLALDVTVSQPVFMQKLAAIRAIGKKNMGAISELFEKCNNRDFIISDSYCSLLQSYELINIDGSVSDTVKAVVLKVVDKKDDQIIIGSAKSSKSELLTSEE